MKIRILSLVGTLFLANILFAGGLVTNTNQSAKFIRTLNNNASTGVDATYFNPAGLTFLADGIHISISNQSIFQTKTTKTSDADYRKAEYEGKVTAIVFPSIYAAYKSDKMAFAAGFMPIGGGGSATYDDGLDLFESDLAGNIGVGIPVSPTDIATVTGYTVDAEFDGSSVYYGIQGAGAYKISDMISVGLGVRYVIAKNTYTGSLKNMTLKTDIGLDITSALNPALPPPKSTRLTDDCELLCIKSTLCSALV